MHRDCPVCRAEGWEALTRVQVSCAGRTIVATLNVVSGDLLSVEEASLSDVAWRAIGALAGDEVTLSPVPPLESLSQLRGKVYGRRLETDGIRMIVADIASNRYSSIHLSAFITACATAGLDDDEVVQLTRAMTAAGAQLQWKVAPVMDKHCVGGLPGNRTSMIVVPIVAAFGLCIPKTSSRAITSPAGTADTMETLAPVELSLPDVRRVVERTGGCVVWGGTMGLSPADDILIRVERPLDLDSEGQLIASVLSKKVAAGSTHVVIDIPVGETAKVRSPEAAALLAKRFTSVGLAVGLTVRVILSDGQQPVGRGIGPALEAWDVLGVLRRDPDAPVDLRDRALDLAGAVLELSGQVGAGTGRDHAETLLANGSANRTFESICQEQGGMWAPPVARLTAPILAKTSGVVTRIDNRRLARIAKLAGAPRAAAAGLVFHVPLGSTIGRGEPLYTLHADAPGELAYAQDYARANADVVQIEATT
jgi:thymidine phosphorylase